MPLIQPNQDLEEMMGWGKTTNVGEDAVANTLPKSVSIGDVNLGTKRTSVSMNPLAQKWIEKNLGEDYVGPAYSTIQEIMDNARKNPNISPGFRPGFGLGYKSMKENELKQQGLVDSSGRFNQQALAADYVKQMTTEKANAVNAAKQKIMSDVMRTLPTPTSPLNNAGSGVLDNTEPQMSPTNKKSYWSEFYSLPQEMRGMLQPGVKKAYYDIMEKALKSAGL